MLADTIEVYPGLEPEPHLVVMCQCASDVLGHRLELKEASAVYRLIGSLQSAAQMLWGDLK